MELESNEATEKVSVLSPKGRIGRIKFLCWGTAFLMLPQLLGPYGLLVLPISFTFYFFTIVKRLRDIGISPLWALVAWVPLLNIPLILIAGKKGENRFGQPPKKYSSSELIFSIFLPIAFIGIISASVIPNYLESYEYYKQRAEAERAAPNK